MQIFTPSILWKAFQTRKVMNFRVLLLFVQRYLLFSLSVLKTPIDTSTIPHLDLL